MISLRSKVGQETRRSWRGQVSEWMISSDRTNSEEPPMAGLLISVSASWNFEQRYRNTGTCWQCVNFQLNPGGENSTNGSISWLLTSYFISGRLSRHSSNKQSPWLKLVSVTCNQKNINVNVPFLWSILYASFEFISFSSNYPTKDFHCFLLPIRLNQICQHSNILSMALL